MKNIESKTTQLESQPECNYYDNKNYRQRRLLPRTVLLQRALSRTLMVGITVFLREIEGKLGSALVTENSREHELLVPSSNVGGLWRVPRCLVME